MKLFRTAQGVMAEVGDRYFRLPGIEWDGIFHAPDPVDLVRKSVAGAPRAERPGTPELLPPIGRQEVWAAGVTYLRSKAARMEEAAEAGGGSFYDRVYDAERPELFFKASPHRVSGPGQPVRIRRDSAWSVPEPELGLAVSTGGHIFGYTIGNDMSARDIEGENPLYLPQAKVYAQCCGLGPGILLAEEPLPPTTAIDLEILREGASAFQGSTRLSEMKRSPEELVEFLLREDRFPSGCFLLTGTGIVPPDEFSLRVGDTIRITIEPIGTLENEVA